MRQRSSARQPLPKARTRAEPPPGRLVEPNPGAIERAFGEMASRIAAASGSGEPTREVIKVAHDLLQSRASYLLRHDAERGLLQVTCVRGRNDARISAVAPGVGAPGRAFTEGRVVREGGMVAVPLGGPRPSGCLVVLAPRFAVSDDLALALAAHLGAALEIARVADVAARRTKDLETAVAGLRSLERSREELLADISHDFKNPLATVKMYLAMLGKQNLGPLAEPQLRAVASCERNADRLLRMINDLLLVSRLKGGEMELSDRPFGLKALTEEILESLASLSARARVRIELGPCAEVFVRGDRDHVREAICHLVESAVHHSADDQSVEVRISVAEGGLALLSVRDSGAPLGEEELKHLFDIFRPQAATPGRRNADGLALPIAAKIVHLHGGRIEAERGKEKGLSLKVYLPMFAGAVRTASELPSPKAGGILLVEDDDDCREVLQQFLEMEGYRVLSATTATQARALLEQVRPALVLLDLRLSEEDGMSVLHFIRGSVALAEVAVYIISGARDLASLSAGEGLDRIDGFFEKPLQLAKVLDTIGSVVRPSQRAAP